MVQLMAALAELLVLVALAVQTMSKSWVVGVLAELLGRP